MTISKIQAAYITDVIEKLIEWTDYTPEYFADKHNLNEDKKEALRAIEILKVSKEKM